MQNTAYSGIDLILFSYPKFLVENLMAYSRLYLFTKTDKLLDLTLFDDLTSIGTIASFIRITKSTSALPSDCQ